MDKLRTRIFNTFLYLLVFVTSATAGGVDEYWTLQPIWSGGSMKGESLLFIKSNNDTADAKLLFKAENILRIYSPSKGIIYEEGRDYKHEPGSSKVSLTAGSRIPFKNKSDMYLKPTSPMSIKASVDGKHDLFYGEGHLFHNLQVEVDYVHNQDLWKADKPKYQLEKLPKTYGILKRGDSLNLVIFGDSISVGANASARVNVKPFMPSYGNLVALGLEEAYGCNVTVTNLSLGGKLSSYGVENAQKVVKVKPDIVIIAWGMNDGAYAYRVTPNQYGRNIKAQIESIKKTLPDCEFILVSTMYGNPEWRGAAPDLYPLYRNELKKLCGKGVILADVTSVFGEILKHKSFWSITNNGLNHPNDFGHRLYAQVILSLLVPESRNFKLRVKKIKYPHRNESQKSFELIEDRHFKKGFKVLNPKHGKYVEIGDLKTDDNVVPVWRLAQWHSKFDILSGESEKVGKSGFIFKNSAKKITLGLHDADITLFMNSVPEYNNNLRKDGQPWPHLLVSQKIENCPNLAELKGLDFTITAKILYSKTFKKEGYSKKLHTAHIPYVLVIKNTNKKSHGYGDFIWFLVTIYDDRYKFPREFLQQDTADPSAKMIYDPGGRRYYSKSFHSGDWEVINCDLLPVILEALSVSWERGYLKDSRDLSDYTIASMNLGWEITGLNEVEIAIKELSLKAVINK